MGLGVFALILGDNIIWNLKDIIASEGAGLQSNVAGVAGDEYRRLSEKVTRGCPWMARLLQGSAPLRMTAAAVHCH